MVYTRTSRFDATAFDGPQQREPDLWTLTFVLIVAVLRLWMPTATKRAWLGGDDLMVWPGLAVSAAGLLRSNRLS